MNNCGPPPPAPLLKTQKMRFKKVRSDKCIEVIFRYFRLDRQTDRQITFRDISIEIKDARGRNEWPCSIPYDKAGVASKWRHQASLACLGRTLALPAQKSYEKCIKHNTQTPLGDGDNCLTFVPNCSTSYVTRCPSLEKWQ